MIPRFVERAPSGRPIEIHGDETQTRCFCHVTDTIRALKGLMEERSISGSIFNVGSTVDIRIVDLADRVKEIVAGVADLVTIMVKPARALATRAPSAEG